MPCVLRSRWTGSASKLPPVQWVGWRGKSIGSAEPLIVAGFPVVSRVAISYVQYISGRIQEVDWSLMLAGARQLIPPHQEDTQDLKR